MIKLKQPKTSLASQLEEVFLAREGRKLETYQVSLLFVWKTKVIVENCSEETYFTKFEASGLQLEYYPPKFLPIKFIRVKFSPPSTVFQIHSRRTETTVQRFSTENLFFPKSLRIYWQVTLYTYTDERNIRAPFLWHVTSSEWSVDI